MKPDHLHIVSFNIPWPPDYGGVIDVFYKLKYLSEQKVKIHLHCFQYGRTSSNELEKYCENVYYYKRKKGIKYFFNTLPYLVVTRSDKQLISRLCSNNYPILFEGIHTTFFLKNKNLTGRLKMIRTHNIEYKYYYFLARAEHNWIKKIFFITEALKLKRYEYLAGKYLQHIAISNRDYDYYSQRFRNVEFLPAFHPFTDLENREGLGDYILYHGDLSVKTNEKIVISLISNVLNSISFPIIIAGKNPSKKLTQMISIRNDIKLISNPGEDAIRELVSNAQINIIPGFQKTGMAIKLLYVLFIGRHCITNQDMVENTGLEELCIVGNTHKQIREAIQKLISIPFKKQDIERRRSVLEHKFSNTRNAKRLIKIIETSSAGKI